MWRIILKLGELCQNPDPVKLGAGGTLDLSDKSKPKVLVSFLRRFNSAMKFILKFWLIMPGGSGSGCPNNQQRRAEVHFVCGVADEITYVQEPSTCIYRFDFTTPAACQTTPKPPSETL